MRRAVICYIGIGSNMGDRRYYIERAISEIRNNKKVKFRRASSIYETDPVGDLPQDKFLNGVLEIETDLVPKSLLRELHNIEYSLGRERKIKNGPRTIDLDILYYGDLEIHEKDLMIPHPRIKEREFVLKGLKELGKI